MKFRPCIDIHNGKVKQIVGKTLQDESSRASENFSTEREADYFAKLYREDGLIGGHVILLNPADSPYFAATKAQALKALQAYPGGLQLGGGVNPDNAAGYLDAGASHVIVTSYVFSDGQIRWENLEKLRTAVGREHLVLDLSCARKADDAASGFQASASGSQAGDGGSQTMETVPAYYVVTDRWQKFTDVQVSPELLEELSSYCDEFLIHGVDKEGQKSGVDAPLVKLLADYAGSPDDRDSADSAAKGRRPVTYAGGIGSMADLMEFKDLTGGKVDFTIGSALDLFGGELPYREVVQLSKDGY